MDALSLSWEGMLAYALPPVPLLMKVLLKMEKLVRSSSFHLARKAIRFPSSAFIAGCSQYSNAEESFDPASFPPCSSEAGEIQPARLAVLQGGLKKA